MDLHFRQTIAVLMFPVVCLPVWPVMDVLTSSAFEASAKTAASLSDEDLS